MRLPEYVSEPEHAAFAFFKPASLARHDFLPPTNALRIFLISRFVERSAFRICRDLVFCRFDHPPLRCLDESRFVRQRPFFLPLLYRPYAQRVLRFAVFFRRFFAAIRVPARPSDAARCTTSSDQRRVRASSRKVPAQPC